MSHLHRQLAANAAIAADKESTHPCTPTVVAAPEESLVRALKRSPRVKSKGKVRRRGKA